MTLTILNLVFGVLNLALSVNPYVKRWARAFNLIAGVLCISVGVYRLIEL